MVLSWQRLQTKNYVIEKHQFMEKLMTFEKIKEIRARVAAKLRNIDNTENSDDVIELTLEELSAISGGRLKESEPTEVPCGSGCYKLD